MISIEQCAAMALKNGLSYIVAPLSPDVVDYTVTLCDEFSHFIYLACITM